MLTYEGWLIDLLAMRHERCPNLYPEPITAENWERVFDESAFDCIRHSRAFGLKVTDLCFPRSASGPWRISTATSKV